MSAYIIARIKVDDSAVYDRYRAQTPDVVARYGGRFIVRGGRCELLEGDSAELDRTVVIQFDSYEQARTFYRSPEYQAIIGLRLNAARSEVLLVEGIDGA